MLGAEFTQEQDEARVPSPPYVSYLTFKNFIQWLETEGVPLRLDRSMWEKKYSGSTGLQLLNGLRFLGLLQDETPTQELEKLVNSPSEGRNAALAELFKRAYTKIPYEDLPRATPGMLRGWMASYGISGDTLRKAESFFVNAAKDVDIPLSNSLRKTARNRPPASGKRANQRATTKGARKDPPANPESVQQPLIEQSSTTSNDRAMAQDSLLLWGLFKRLPSPGTEFSAADRETWLETAKSILNLEYKEEAQ